MECSNKHIYNCTLPVSYPSLVICKRCQQRVTETLQALIEDKTLEEIEEIRKKE